MDMTRPPSSLESTFALLEKDKERLASDGKEKIRKKREERHIEFNTPDQEVSLYIHMYIYACMMCIYMYVVCCVIIIYFNMLSMYVCMYVCMYV